jgi:hypothetical protein
MTTKPNIQTYDRALRMGVVIMLMILSIILIGIYYQNESPYRYFGLVGFALVGWFWNDRVIDY